MINGQSFFDQLVRNNFITHENIGNIAIGQKDDNTTGCLLDHDCFNDYDKKIATDLN